jgi:hypothetical protein
MDDPTSRQGHVNHVLFLSHAGADTEQALHLAERIESSEAAKQANLRVWIDKHSLAPGLPWQDQLDEAIAHKSTAFAVYVPKAGAENWVLTEIRAALDRVIAERKAGRTFPFIPILAESADAIANLPSFAQQYHGIVLSEGDAAIQKVIGAAIQASPGQPVPLVAEPFVDLSAFEASQAHLFFGREQDTAGLLKKLQSTSLLMVIGDSGAGKSSVVKAGVVPAFRDGKLASRSGPRPDSRLWHVIEMRPRGNPFENLVVAITNGARNVQPNAEMLSNAIGRLRKFEIDAVRDAVREGAPANAQVLLVIDQFEELWTQTFDADMRKAFLDALIALTPAGDATNRVVLTMRRDYYFQCAAHRPFIERLEANDRQGLYSLRRMRDDQLRDCIEKPLALAGIAAQEADELATEVLRDAGDQPGDLALIEVALTRTWQHRQGGELLDAYRKIGRVEGALEQAAREMLDRIGPDRTRHAETLFMRLVTQSADGSVTRRVARKREFAPDVWHLAQDLAKAEFSRLVVIGESTTGDDTVELAHEQLAARWSQYLSWLREPRERVDHKRTLDWLMDDAARWLDTRRGWGDVASGRKLVDARALRQAHDSWLSAYEKSFVARSSFKASSVKGIAAVMVVMICAGGWLMQAQTRDREIRNFANGIWEALEFSEQPTTDEVKALARLQEAGDDERFAFLERLRSSEKLAEHYLRQPDLVTRAAVGADLDLRDRVLSQLVEAGPAGIEQNSARRLGLAMLGSRLGNFEGWQRVLSDSEHGAAYREFVSGGVGEQMNDALVGMPPEKSASFAEAALNAMEKSVNSTAALTFYARLLCQLPATLTPEQSKRAFAAMRGAIIHNFSGTGADALFKYDLEFVLRSMPFQVDAQLLQQAFETYQVISIAQQNKGTLPDSYIERFDLEGGSFVHDMVRKVPPEQALEVIRVAIAAMDRAAAASPRTEFAIARSLGGLDISAVDARQAMGLLSAKLDRMPRWQSVYGLSNIVVAVAERVAVEDSSAIRDEFVAIMARRSQQPATVAVSISAIAALHGPVDGQTASAMVERLSPFLLDSVVTPSPERKLFLREIYYATPKTMERVPPEVAAKPFTALMAALEKNRNVLSERIILIRTLAKLKMELDRELAQQTFKQLLPNMELAGQIRSPDGSTLDGKIGFEMAELAARVAPSARKDVAMFLLNNVHTPVSAIAADQLSWALRNLQSELSPADRAEVVELILPLMKDTLSDASAFVALHDSIDLITMYGGAEARIAELLPAAIEKNKNNPDGLAQLLKIRGSIRGNEPSLNESLAKAAGSCKGGVITAPTDVVAQSVSARYGDDQIVVARTILAAMEASGKCESALLTMGEGLRKLPKAEEMPEILDMTLATMERNTSNESLLLELANFLIQPGNTLPPEQRRRLNAIAVTVLSSEANTIQALCNLGTKFSGLPLELDAERGRRIMRRYVAAIRTSRTDSETSLLVNALLAVETRVPDDESVAQAFVVALENPWSRLDARILEAMQARFTEDLPSPLYKWDAIRWTEEKFGKSI